MTSQSPLQSTTTYDRSTITQRTMATTSQSLVAEIGQTISVPMKTGPSPRVEVDLGEMSREDLENLRQQDPFLYYSIPAAQKALIFGKDSDADPSYLMTRGASQQASEGSIVERRSMLSTECPLDVVLEGLLDFPMPDGGSEMEKEIEDEMAELLGLMARKTGMRCLR